MKTDLDLGDHLYCMAQYHLGYLAAASVALSKEHPGISDALHFFSLQTEALARAADLIALSRECSDNAEAYYAAETAFKDAMGAMPHGS